MSMRIATLYVRDIMRLREIRISPDVDRAVVLVGGDNANGKTSLLKSIEVALGGKRYMPADPVRHGAEDGEIRIDLTDGKETLIVRRLIANDGESVLEVRDSFGAMKAPQAVLDKLIGARFLDPLLFRGMSADDQRKALLRLVDRNNEIPTLDHKRERAYARRTEIGRDLKKAVGEAQRLPAGAVAQPIDVGALLAEDRTLEAASREHGKRTRSLNDARTASANASAARVRLELEISKLQAELANAHEIEMSAAQRVLDAKTAIDAVPDADNSAPRRDEIRSEIERANVHNAKVAAAQAQGERRRAVEAEIKTYEADHLSMSLMIEDIDKEKARILDAAALPVDGLGISADGITYNGVPFAQASAAEQYRISIGIAIAANPDLRDIWIRDGALLDDSSLALVSALAEESGVRLWIERVSDRDPGAIIIHDGMLRDAQPTPAAVRPVAPLVLE